MMILTGKTLVSALRPPYPYGTEFVQQFLFMLRLCWLPLTISMIAVSYGAPGLQAGNFLVLFGAIDRLGGFFVLASIREFAPLVTAIILAGVGGTAITADLGARKIREELDALQVLGVDPIKNLVVPRFLALMVVTGLFNLYAIIFGHLRRDPGHALRSTLRWARSSPPCSTTRPPPTSGARWSRRPCSAPSSRSSPVTRE